MLVYEKGTGENRHLYGTMNNIPSDTDNQLVYEDADGDVITPTLAGTYVDDGHGGILMKGEDGDTFVGVYVKKPNNDLVNIIPGGSYQPEEKVLKSIRFKKKPTKLDYVVGEDLDMTGAVIEATFESGEKEIAYKNNKFMEGFGGDLLFSPSDDIVATEGDTKITADIGYNEENYVDTECSVTVTEAQENTEED